VLVRCCVYSCNFVCVNGIFMTVCVGLVFIIIIIILMNVRV
jgi:hypothetical protein